MRGCHGRTVEQSIASHQNLKRRTTRGEFADDWRYRRDSVDKKMHELKKAGKCTDCPHFGVKRSCPEREFTCTLAIDDFGKICKEMIKK